MHGRHRRPSRPAALAHPAPVLGAHRRRPHGWITTRPTPLKQAHLAHSPHVSCSYWDATQDTAIAEYYAAWVADPDTRAHAWELFRAAPEPLGHDPYAIWPDGPSDPDAGVLRLRPWRIRVVTMETLLGRSKPLDWTPATLNQPS